MVDPSIDLITLQLTQTYKAYMELLHLIAIKYLNTNNVRAINK